MTKAPAKTRDDDALDQVRTVPIPGTRFLELQGRHEAGSLEDLKLRFTRRVIFLARRWQNRLNEALRKAGHSHARWITLVWVHLIGGEANHGELADAIGVELPTLIRLLNRLEEEGLVERRMLTGAGRAKTVRLTASGRKLLTRLNAIVEETRDDFLAHADPDKLKIAMSLFDDLLADATRKS